MSFKVKQYVPVAQTQRRRDAILNQRAATPFSDDETLGENYHYRRTAWATIGLVETIDEAGRE